MRLREKRLEGVEAQLASVIESADDGIVILNSSGEVIIWNKGAERLFGFSSEEMVGRPYGDILEGEDLVDFSMMFHRVMGGEAVHYYETTRPRRDGTARDVSLSMSPIFAPDGSIVGESTFIRDITERKRHENELSESVDKLELAQRVGRIGSWTTGLSPGAPLRCTTETFRIFGTEERSDLTTTDFYDRVHPDDLVRVRTAMTSAVEQAGHYELEHRIVRPDGTEKWVFEAADVICDELGKPIEMTGVVQDVTERRMNEEKSRGIENRLRLLAENARDLIFYYRIKPTPGFEFVSPGSVGITGYTPEELYDDPELIDRILNSDLRDVMTEQLMSGRDESAGDLEVTRKDGSKIWANQQVHAVRDSSGSMVAVQGITRDISDRKSAELRLSHEILHDALTGLANHVLLMERIDRGLLRASRTDTHLAVLFVDLDRFKQINDAGGHSRGDAVLKAVARRLDGRARPTETVARFSGDEFVILCEDLSGETDAVEIAVEILESFKNAFIIGGQEVYVRASIGVATAPGTTKGQTADEMLRHADLAMYRAKARGRGRYELFDDSLRAKADRRSNTEAALHRALEGEGFKLVFQPVWSIVDQRFLGAEVLLRLNDPELGVVGPDEFIPVAEDCGLIVPIGAWVLDKACAVLAEWSRMGAHMATCTLSVNVSAVQLRSRPFLAGLALLIADSGVDPALLCLEITESVLMEDVEFFTVVLHHLRDIGVTVSIDDFGTGYSSLAYLRRFPVSELKIDQSFISGLGADTFDGTLVKAVIMIGGALGLRVVAEGVETMAQLSSLRDLGGDFAQGYLFARPCELEECRSIIEMGGTYL